MPPPVPSSRLPASPRRPRAHAPGFSLIEVILAIGILAVAIITLLGLIGPTLGYVKTVIDTNAAISCISKMNAQLETSPFYAGNTTTLANSSVYTWVAKSNATNPTVFFFYDEAIPAQGGGAPLVVPRVAAYFDGADATTKSFTAVSPLTGEAEGSLQYAVANGRLAGPVIAMALSLSPLTQNMPPPLGGTSGVYPTANADTGLFVTANLPQDPNATASPSIAYPEAYLPILVQVFTVPLDKIAVAGIGNSNTQFNPAADLTESNRLFTYTTAKVR